MFCKWCGETVIPADRQCRRCGRELPALSDCGGFYDLVNLGTPAAAAQSRPQSVKVDLSGVQNEIRHASAAERKRMNRLWLLTLIGFALTLVLLLMLLFRIGSLHTRIDTLTKSVEALQTAQQEDAEPEDAQTQTESTESTEDTQASDPDSFWNGSETDPTDAEATEEPTI